MPHYKDGTEALPGDIARGKGYNIPHEVTGVVLQVFPAESCNLRISVATEKKYPADLDFKYQNFINAPVGPLYKKPDGSIGEVELNIEAGSVQEFELVYRPEATK